MWLDPYHNIIMIQDRHPLTTSTFRRSANLRTTITPTFRHQRHFCGSTKLNHKWQGDYRNNGSPIPTETAQEVLVLFGHGGSPCFPQRDRFKFFTDTLLILWLKSNQKITRPSGIAISHRICWRVECKSVTPARLYCGYAIFVSSIVQIHGGRHSLRVRQSLQHFQQGIIWEIDVSKENVA